MHWPQVITGSWEKHVQCTQRGSELNSFATWDVSVLYLQLLSVHLDHMEVTQVLLACCAKETYAPVLKIYIF